MSTSSRCGASLAIALLAGSCGDAEPSARAYVIEDLSGAVGGPKAIAQPGDLVLENEHARVAILGARSSLGPGLNGGSLVDADLKRSDPAFAGGRGLDQLAELFPTVNMIVPEPNPETGGVEIVADGSDGEAVVRVRGTGQAFLTLLDALWALPALDSPDFYLWTDYVARPDEPWFTLRTTITTGEGGPAPQGGEEVTYHTSPFPLIEWALESGLVVGDFYLQGGSVDVFAPGIGFDEDGAVYLSMQAGLNSFIDPFQYGFLAGVADGVSYGLAPKRGDLFVPLFTASQTIAVGGAEPGDGTPERFPPGQAFTYERYFFVGHGDVASVFDQYLEARQIPYGVVQGSVLEVDTLDPVSGASVFLYPADAQYPISQFGTDIHPDDREPDGSFVGRVPPGSWDLVAHQRGRPPSDRVRIEVEEGATVSVALPLQRAGTVSFTVRDERGRQVPAKVSFFRADGQRPTIDPVLGDSFVAGSPEAVVFATYGRGTVELPPGRFTAMASRGIEYELDVEDFEVDATQAAEIDLQVVRSVDTSGWIGADLHVHAERSHDSGVQLAERVQTMVAEGVEFFASTDHDYLVDYAPTVEALGVEEWVQTAVGNETTTVEIGHFLAFPLGQDFLVEAGGGRDAVDWTGKSPEEIVSSLRTMGQAVGHEPFVFVGHPRDGILGYFDQYGFDPYGGTPGSGGAPGTPAVSPSLLTLMNPLITPGYVTWDFDGLELLNGKRFELLRTPTAPEVEGFAAGTADVYDYMVRTMEEQRALEDQVFPLDGELEGHVDDWFTLLNLGFRFTALGNSDTHGITSIEAGCPRNFVRTDEDEPAFLDDQAVADAIREHRVVASYGPFLRMWVNGAEIGSEIVEAGPLQVQVEVQAPSWIPVHRVELYENGALVKEWVVEDGSEVLRFNHAIERNPAGDAWYVAIAMGDGDLGPVFTPVEIPYVDLQQIVSEALAGVESVASLVPPAAPIPREFPIRPFAITNPVWVDRAGDGFDAPGHPSWLHAP